jgi:predicted DsbA family dithiol-disulfide isomerase
MPDTRHATIRAVDVVAGSASGTPPTYPREVRIDVWSDILCPFCHLGRRHLELALERFEHADEVEVQWHSFQLDRNAPAVDDTPNVDRIAAKYGVPREQMVLQQERMAADAAGVGLDFQWERLRGGNSYDAHRLIHLARSLGREEEASTRVMRAWYSEGEAIGDHETLVRLAVEAGLMEADVRELLAGDDFGIDVRTDLALAAQVRITAVPTFVLDEKYGVSGAQPVDVLLDAVRQVWALQGTEPEPVAASGGCGGGCCGGACGSGSTTDAVEETATAGCACGSDSCGSATDAVEEKRVTASG